MMTKLFERLRAWLHAPVLQAVREVSVKPDEVLRQSFVTTVVMFEAVIAGLKDERAVLVAALNDARSKLGAYASSTTQLGNAQEEVARLTSVLAACRQLSVDGIDVPGEIVGSAVVYVRQENKDNPASAGEGKRHRVYGKLRRQFPKAPGRSVSLAIEIALSNA